MVATSLKTILILGFVCLLSAIKLSAAIPKPDHVVICVLENHSYNQIIGSADAPYINSLLAQSANMMEYYALTHPSQPNYIMLFSGHNQGETSNNLPSGTPFTTPNLGASLLQNGYTFMGYSEDLPTTGSLVGSSGAYARKHSPWVHWQGNGPNQIPSHCNVSMNAFPTEFESLPDLSFVIPNQNNDMHNGSDPSRIQVGDDWIKQNLKPYIDWAQENNSLFILFFDEDNITQVNHVACLFTGQMVQPGNYFTNGYNHYDMLRTLEDMFGLPYAGNSATATPIEEIWRQTTSVETAPVIQTTSVFPNPITDYSQLSVTVESSQFETATLVVYDISGRRINEREFELNPGKNQVPFKRENLPGGIFTYQLVSDGRIFGSGKVVVD